MARKGGVGSIQKLQRNTDQNPIPFFPEDREYDAGSPYLENDIRPFPRVARVARGRHAPMLGQQRNTGDVADDPVGELIPERAALAFARGAVWIGNFGDSDTPASVPCGIAKVRPAYGLPKPGDAEPGNEDSEAQWGWR